jgi:hypothetical protein
MSSNANFFRGRDVILKLYQDGSPIYLAAKNWEVEENATEVADGVNGEDRDRLDLVTNYYSGSVDIFQNDQEQMNNIIDAQTTDDSGVAPLEQHGGILIRQRDGTRAVYALKNMRLGPWKVTQGGRDQAVMLNLKLRFTKWEPVKIL